jgi:hypothetical protein
MAHPCTATNASYEYRKPEERAERKHYGSVPVNGPATAKIFHSRFGASVSRHSAASSRRSGYEICLAHVGTKQAAGIKKARVRIEWINWKATE